MWPVAVLVVVPHGIWAVGNLDQVFALTDGFVRAQGNLAFAVLRTVWVYTVASLGLLLPLALILAVAWWCKRDAGAVVQGAARTRAVLWRWALIFWGIGLLVALAGPAAEVRMRWLMVGATLARAPRAAPFVIWVGVGLGVISVSGQWVQSLWINARTDYDYAALADMIEAEGLPRDLVALSYREFGNLRLYGARVLVAPAVPDPGRIAPDMATAIWDGGRARDEDRVITFAAGLGLCVEGSRDAIGVELVRRHGDGEMPVRMRALSRAACAE